MKSTVINIAKLVVAAGILYYLMFTGKLDFSHIPEAFRYYHLIIIAAVIFIGEAFLVTLRWKILLDGLGIHETYWNLLNFTWIGQFFNNIMLGSVGGDVIKILYVTRHFPGKKAVTGMTVLLDRALGLYCMLFFVFLCLLFAPASLREIPAIQTMFFGVAAFIGISVVGAPLIFSKRVRSKLPLKGIFAELVDAVLLYRDRKIYVLMAFGITFICHIGLVVIFYLLSKALAGNVAVIDLRTMAFIAPAGLVTVAIPIAPAGLGVGQVAFAQLFSWVGSPISTLGANTATLFQLLTMGCNLLGVFAYLSHRPKREPGEGSKVVVEATGEY